MVLYQSIHQKMETFKLNQEVTQDVGARKFLAPYSPLRPKFEELANRMLSLGEGLRSVVITGPEPGTGCSSTCLGLGAALASLGHPAAVVDCNLDRPNLHRVLGEPNFLGLTSGLEGDKPLEEMGFSPVPDLLVVPTGPVPPDPDKRLRSARLVEAVRDLEGSRRLVLLDAPVAGRMLEFATFSEGFGGVLLVVHASRTPKSVARAVTDDLLESGVNLLGVVLNGCP